MKFYLSPKHANKKQSPQQPLLSEKDRRQKASFTVTNHFVDRMVGEEKVLSMKRKRARYVLTSIDDVIYAFKSYEQALGHYKKSRDNYLKLPICVDQRDWKRLVDFYDRWNDIHFPDIENHVVIYTDASVSENSPLGPSTCYGGIALKRQGNQLVVDRMFRVMDNYSLLSTTKAEYLAIKLMHDHYKDHNITFVVDNAQARALLECENDENLMRLFNLFKLNPNDKLDRSNNQIIRCFDVPSHSGSLGNTKVDFFVSTTKVYATCNF